MKKALSAIVAEVESKETAEEQAAVLTANKSGPLKDIIGHALDPGVTFLLPKGNPPYKPFEEGENREARLYAETRMFQYLIKSPEGNKVKQLKREQIFINLLEGIHPDDAKLLLRVKNKELNIKPEAVKIAFPSITKHWP